MNTVHTGSVPGRSTGGGDQGMAARRGYVARAMGSPHAPALGLALGYIILASGVSLVRHWSYNSWTLDLGIFTQSLQYTLQGQVFYNTPEGMSHFGYHFQPIMFLLVPLYWLAPHPETLLVVQSAALGLGGYLVYRLAATQGLSHRASLVVEGLFLLSPLVHGVNFFDFHPVAFAVPALLLMLIGLAQRRWVYFGVGLVLALMTKEDVIAALAVFGAVMLAARYVSNRKIAWEFVVVLMAAIAAGVLAILVAKGVSGGGITPLLGYGKIRYAYIGLPPLQMAVGALTALFSWGSIFLFLAYFWPLGFLPLLSPIWAAPAFFILATDLLASDLAQKTLHQYPAAAIPFLFMALLAALKPRRAGGGMLAISGTASRPLLIASVAVVLGLNFLISLHPSGVFRDVRWPDAHDRAISAVIGLIPDGATVTAPNHIFPHLVSRTIVYSPYEEVKPNSYTGVFGVLDVETQYVIIDQYWLRDYRAARQEHGVEWSRYLGGKYGLVAHLDGVSLLELGYDGEPVLTELDTRAGFNAVLYGDKSFETPVVEAQYFKARVKSVDIGSLIPGILPDDRWGISFSGYVNSPKDAYYRLFMSSDGGALLKVDDEVVRAPGNILSGDINVFLDKGFHTIELYYTGRSARGFVSLELGGLAAYRNLPAEAV